MHRRGMGAVLFVSCVILGSACAGAPEKPRATVLPEPHHMEVQDAETLHLVLLRQSRAQTSPKLRSRKKKLGVESTFKDLLQLLGKPRTRQRSTGRPEKAPVRARP